MCGCLPHAPPTGDLVGNPDMCPDRDLNRPGSQACAQSTEPHQPGQNFFFKIKDVKFFPVTPALPSRPPQGGEKPPLSPEKKQVWPKIIFKTYDVRNPTRF